MLIDGPCTNKVGTFFFLRFYLFISLEEGEGREKEREKNINVWLPLVLPQMRTWPTTQGCALTRNQTSNPLVHRLKPNPLSYTSQGFKLFIYF